MQIRHRLGSVPSIYLHSTIGPCLEALTAIEPKSNTLVALYKSTMPKSYSSKTLMGNWFENRLAPSKVRTKLNLREAENEVATVRIKRFEDATTQGTIADYCQVSYTQTNSFSPREILFIV